MTNLYLRPFGLLTKVTKDDNPFEFGPCGALYVGTAGTANLTFFDGSQADNVPLFAGMNPIEVAGVRTGGTADDIWVVPLDLDYLPPLPEGFEYVTHNGLRVMHEGQYVYQPIGGE
jgi:hypothetical protein